MALKTIPHNPATFYTGLNELFHYVLYTAIFFYMSFQLYRHGDRSPVRIYPKDPHDATAWPEGLGELTNVSYILTK